MGGAGVGVYIDCNCFKFMNYQYKNTLDDFNG